MIEALAIKIGAALVPVTDEAFKRMEELPVAFELVTTPRFVGLAEKATTDPEGFKKTIDQMVDDLANEFRTKLRLVVHMYCGLDGRGDALAGMKNLAGIQIPFCTLPINLHTFSSVVKKSEASIEAIRAGKLDEAIAADPTLAMRDHELLDKMGACQSSAAEARPPAASSPP